MERSESIVKVSQALVKAQRDMPNAVKDSKNPFFKSNYADLNSIREACIPSLNAHGISVLQPIEQRDGKSYVRTVFLHESGEMISSDIEVIVSKQNDPQAYGSAVSYARRYGLQSFICLGAEDDDGESAHGRNVGKSSSSPEPRISDVVSAVSSAQAAVKANPVIVKPVAPVASGAFMTAAKGTALKQAREKMGLSGDQLQDHVWSLYGVKIPDLDSVTYEKVMKWLTSQPVSSSESPFSEEVDFETFRGK